MIFDITVYYIYKRFTYYLNTIIIINIISRYFIIIIIINIIISSSFSIISITTIFAGKPLKFHEGLRLPDKERHVCCRRDVARFMLDVSEKGEFKRKCMAIASS